jgi:hypothetical protein
MEQKNHYLEKFLLISEAELLNFESDDFDNLEAFYDCREKILGIVRHIEKKIEQVSQEYTQAEAISDDHKRRLRVEMDFKDQLANKILELDLRLISRIETAKSAIIRQLQTVRQGKKAVSGYKSELGPKYSFNEEA